MATLSLGLKMLNEESSMRTCSYSEAAYFDGDFCQHVADKEEHERLERKLRQARNYYSRVKSRKVIDHG